MKQQLHQQYTLMIKSICENSFRTKQTLLTHPDRTNELNAVNPNSAQKLIITQHSPDIEIPPSRARTLYYI